MHTYNVYSIHYNIIAYITVCIVCNVCTVCTVYIVCNVHSVYSSIGGVLVRSAHEHVNHCCWCICSRRVFWADWSMAELKRVFVHKTVAERAGPRQ